MANMSKKAKINKQSFVNGLAKAWPKLPSFEESIKKEKSLSPCTMIGACPECGGDAHDGTGVGWYCCFKCGYIW